MTRPKILVCGWIGSTNLGDQLIAAEVADLINDEGGDPTLVTIDPKRTGGLQWPTVRHAGALDTVALAAATRNHDGVIFGGGGLIQDETGPLNLPFHFTRLVVGRLHRRPWAGLALGVGDVQRRSGRLLARAALQAPVACTVRDAASADRFEQLVGWRPEIGIDPVLAGPATPTPDEPFLVVSLRPANTPGQRRLDDRAAPDDTQIKRWANAIDRIAGEHDWGVRFVAWDRTHDESIHAAIASRISAPSTLETPDPESIIDRMGCGKAVISMRYHGAVAAIRCQKPALVLDYSPKMADLVREFDDAALVLVDPAVSADDLVKAFDRLPTAATAAHHDSTTFALRTAANRSVVAQLVAATVDRR